MSEVFTFKSAGDYSQNEAYINEVPVLTTALNGVSSLRECVYIKEMYVICPRCGESLKVEPRYGVLDDLPQFNTGDHFRFEELFQCGKCGEQIDLMSGGVLVKFVFRDNSESTFRLSFTDYFTITPLNQFNIGCYLTFTRECEDWVLAHR